MAEPGVLGTWDAADRDAVDELDERGNPIADQAMLLLLNAAHLEVGFKLPRVARREGDWEMVLDTVSPPGEGA